MSHRQREWARRIRDGLINILGGKCVKCGSIRKLEFDLIIPTGNNDHHRKMEWSWRMSFYRRQHDIGNVQLLCEMCNKKKQNKMELLKTNSPDIPF